ncbi:MAG: PAS domain S-box protein [Ignavibacteriales bacterium]|nr:MAG: PAS domain S-box protein [Ignavibacteriales bacterium]
MNEINFNEQQTNPSAILIADDNPVNLSLLEICLTTAGYKTYLAPDGRKALDMVYQHKPDLLLLDVFMPGLSGFEVCSIVKKDIELKTIPIIFMTGAKDSESKLKGFDLGAADFIGKPFQNEEILARIKLHLSLVSMQKELKTRNALLQEEVNANVKKSNELLESENRYKQLAEISPDIILVYSKEKIHYINPAGISLLGIDSPDLMNTNFPDYIHPDDVHLVEEGIGFNSAGKKEKRVFELRLKTKNGKEIYVDVFLAQIIYYSQEAILVVGRDVSERKNYEEALLQSQERFKNLVQNVSGYIYSVHYENGIPHSAYHSPQCFAITGYTPEEYLVDSFLWITMVYPEDRPRVEKFFVDLDVRIKTTSIEHRIVRKDGQVVWISNSFTIHSKNENEIADIYGYIHDITHRKNTENILQQQNEFLQKIMDSIPNPIYYKDVEGYYRGCNVAFEKNVGLTKSEIIGKTVFDVAAPEFVSVYDKMDKELLSNPGVQVYEYYVRLPDGSYHNVVFNKATFQNPNNTVGGIVGIIVDITELKQIQNELQETLEKLKVLETSITNSPAVVFIWRNESRMYIDFVSENIIQFGYTAEDFIFHRMQLSDFIYHEDLETVISEINYFTDQYFNEFNQEYRIITKSGEIRWVDIRTWIQRDEDKKPNRYHSVLIDITKRKSAEFLLKENKERYQTLAENSYDLICEVNDKLNFLYLSPNFYDLLGYLPEEMLHRNLLEIVHLDDIPNVMRESKRLKTRIVLRIKHKNGDWRWFESAAKQYSTANGEKRGVIVSRDITQRKQIEKQLIQSEKMVAVGEMSAMIAHEFRNALTSVKMILQLTGESDNLSSSEKKSFGVAINSIYHMEKIVQQLLTFSHPAPTEQSIEDINIIIQDCLYLIQVEAVKKGITITSKLADNVPLLLLNSSNIKESIVNILFNAMQAFDNYNKGSNRKIKVITKKTIVQEDIKDLSYYSKPILSGGRYLDTSSELIIYQGSECVLIEVKDNGKGMDEECLARIFQPFFTTKEKGSGLGLPIVKKNINAQGGILTVESQVNKGTSFKIYLPITSIQ